jgi:predicted secreted protein
MAVENCDSRSKKLVICCHCVLNQNAKLEGIAGWPGMINEVIKVIQDSGAGILQMGCPEMIYEGIGRFDKSYEQYDCAAFREICASIASETADQIKNYQQWGYTVAAILAVDGSPSCGFNLTQSAPEWKGLVAENQFEKVRYIDHKGILFEHLESELEGIEKEISIIGIPEIPKLGSLEKTLSRLKDILGVKEVIS